MNRIARFGGCMSLAIAMALGGTAAAGPVVAAGVSSGSVHFYLADPELGLAGVYTGNGTELYFEARRTFDAKSGGPGALSLRVIDAQARTLAMAGAPYSANWEPQRNEFLMKEGFSYAHLLDDLGQALEQADLHRALDAEKSALASLSRQAADVPAASFPLRSQVEAKNAAATDLSLVADFYLEVTRPLTMKRKDDGVLSVDLGHGINFQSTQQFLPDEPDDEGNYGRIDAYSIVLDSEGYVLAAELGGDLMPQAWSEALEMETTRDHHALATDFGSAAMALNALAYSGKSSHGVALSYQVEVEAMQRLAQSLSEQLLPVRDVEAGKPVRGMAQTKSGGRYLTDIAVWRKPFVVIAEHSGTRVRKWLYNSTTSSVRTLKGTVNFCNHGTCPGGSSMTQKCFYSGYRTTGYRVPARGSDAGGHTCTTSYWAIARKGHHNCHDDSSVQVSAVRGRSYSRTGGRCGDSVFWSHAPTCS